MKRVEFETEMRERVEGELLYLLTNARSRSVENENHPATDDLTRAFHPRYRAALGLLIDAIENDGLLERLVAEKAETAELAEARAQVEQAAASPLSSTPLAVAFGAAVPAQRDGEQAERTSLAEQLRAVGSEQAARDEEANEFAAQQRADETERDGEQADGGAL